MILGGIRRRVTLERVWLFLRMSVCGPVFEAERCLAFWKKLWYDKNEEECVEGSVDGVIRIAMCDDEAVFLQTYQKQISELLLEHNEICKIDTYTDTECFLEHCEKNVYDLIFLDIDMPEMSGIQLASKFRDNGVDTTLVFVSSHDDFVFETFRYNAYRFVRKNKLLSDTQEMISSFCASLKRKSAVVRFDIGQKKAFEQKVSDIVYFYSIRHDTYFVNAQNESIRLAMHSYTMNALEKQFAEKGFIRVHKSYLVNYAWILQIKGDQVYLKNYHKEVPLSRGRSEEAKLQYQRLIREAGVL
ncbi:LytR/AlgR family response regulator transcription factor [Ruminococcus sp.]